MLPPERLFRDTRRHESNRTIEKGTVGCRFLGQACLRYGHQFAGRMVQHGNPAERESALLYDDPASLPEQFAPVANANDRRVDSTQHRMDPAQTREFLLLRAAIGYVTHSDERRGLAVQDNG